MYVYIYSGDRYALYIPEHAVSVYVPVVWRRSESGMFSNIFRLRKSQTDRSLKQKRAIIPNGTTLDRPRTFLELRAAMSCYKTYAEGIVEDDGDRRVSKRPYRGRCRR